MSFLNCLAFKLATGENLYVKHGFVDMGIWFSLIYVLHSFEKTSKYFFKGFLLITCFNKIMLIIVTLFIWLRLVWELNLSPEHMLLALVCVLADWFIQPCPCGCYTIKGVCKHADDVFRKKKITSISDLISYFS